MFIYTLYYKDTGLYDTSVFVKQNKETAIKTIKLNLMDKNAERFRNECTTGDVLLKQIAKFSENTGLVWEGTETICNLKDLLNEIKENLETNEKEK